MSLVDILTVKKYLRTRNYSRVKEKKIMSYKNQKLKKKNAAATTLFLLLKHTSY